MDKLKLKSLIQTYDANSFNNAKNLSFEEKGMRIYDYRSLNGNLAG